MPSPQRVNSDKKIRDFASTLDEYERLVGYKAHTIIHGKPPRRHRGTSRKKVSPVLIPKIAQRVGHIAGSKMG